MKDLHRQLELGKRSQALQCGIRGHRRPALLEGPGLQCAQHQLMHLGETCVQMQPFGTQMVVMPQSGLLYSLGISCVRVVRAVRPLAQAAMSCTGMKDSMKADTHSNADRHGHRIACLEPS